MAVLNADGTAVAPRACHVEKPVGPDVASHACHVEKPVVDDTASECSSSSLDSEADRLDTIYRAIFDTHFSDFHSDVPSLSAVTDLLRKFGLKPDLLERFAQRYIHSRVERDLL